MNRDLDFYSREMDNIDEAIELLEQALLRVQTSLDSNMDDAGFKIDQAIMLLDNL
mgnify:CR=1 FL=1|tara:strand:- start:247 stop:411 length:165 start_codon:yes stop_codon:yes gene_type:complete